MSDQVWLREKLQAMYEHAGADICECGGRVCEYRVKADASAITTEELELLVHEISTALGVAID